MRNSAFPFTKPHQTMTQKPPTTFIKLLPAFVKTKIRCPHYNTILKLDDSRRFLRYQDIQYRIYWMKKRKRRQMRSANLLHHARGGEILELESSAAAGGQQGHNSDSTTAQSNTSQQEEDDDPLNEIDDILQRMEQRELEAAKQEGRDPPPNINTKKAPSTTNNTPALASPASQDYNLASITNDELLDPSSASESDSYKILSKSFLSDQIAHTIQYGDETNTHLMSKNESRVKLRHLEQQLLKRPEWREHFDAMIPIVDLRTWKAEDIQTTEHADGMRRDHSKAETYGDAQRKELEAEKAREDAARFRGGLRRHRRKRQINVHSNQSDSSVFEA